MDREEKQKRGSLVKRQIKPMPKHLKDVVCGVVHPRLAVCEQGAQQGEVLLAPSSLERANRLLADLLVGMIEKRGHLSEIGGGRDGPALAARGQGFDLC